MRIVVAVLVLAVAGPTSWGAVEHRCRVTGAVIQPDDCSCDADAQGDATARVEAGSCCDVVRSDGHAVPVVTVDAVAHLDRTPVFVVIAAAPATGEPEGAPLRRPAARAAPPPDPTPLYLRTRSLLI